MTRRRARKLMMAAGYDRNMANIGLARKNGDNAEFCEAAIEAMRMLRGQFPECESVRIHMSKAGAIRCRIAW